MSEFTLENLEKMIMKGDAKVLLKDLTPYGETYIYVDLMSRLNDPETDLKTLENAVENFYKNKNFNEYWRLKIKAKFLFLSLERSETQEERELSLDKINALIFKCSFNYKKPEKLEYREEFAAGENSQVIQSFLSQEESKTFTFDFFLEKFYKEKNPEMLDQFNSDFLNKIDLNRFSFKKDLELIENIINRTNEIFMMNGLIEFVLYHKINFPKKSFIETNIIPKLNKNQIAKIFENPEIKKNETIIKYYFEHHFVDENDINLDLDQKIKKLEEMKKTAKEKIPEEYSNLLSLITLSILSIKNEKNEVDENLFKEYLENFYVDNNLKVFYNESLKNKFKEKKKKIKVVSFTSCLLVDIYKEDQIINRYLEMIFEKGETYESFSHYEKYFAQSHLKKIFYQRKIEEGKNIIEAKNFFTDFEFQEFNQKKILDILNNKKNFNLEEDVKISVKLKNIAKLKIRIFEINSLNYLLEMASNNYWDLNVNGLIASEELSFVYDQPPMIIHNAVFDFPQIQSKKRGVFVIEFIGDNLIAKATIQKGNLTFIHDNISGRNSYILDENLQICKSEETGIYLDKKFYKANPQTGVITLDDVLIERSFTPILCYENFCQLGNTVTLKSLTNYNLELNLIYNPEAFIPGNDIKLIYNLNLSLNQQKVDLGKLENVCIEIFTVNEENIENKVELKNVKLSSKKDYETSLICPPKLKKLYTVVKGEIKNNIKPLIVQTSRKTLALKKNENIFEIFLKRNSERDFLLEIIGKNGEPWVQKYFDVKLFSRFSTNVHNFKLITNKEGKINLGKLKDIVRIQVNQDTKSLIVFETIPFEDVYYPNEIELIENENFEIVYNNEKFSLHTLRDNYYVSEDITSKNTHVSENKIILNNLKKGSYYLFIGDKKIMIKVIKGSLLDINGLKINTDDFLKNVNSNNVYFKYEVKKEAEDIVIDIIKNSEDIVNAYLFTFNWEDEKIRNYLLNLVSTSVYPNEEIFYKNKAYNFYSNSNILDQEILYCYDRKNKKSFLGNTLEKPGIILTREMNREIKDNNLEEDYLKPLMNNYKMQAPSKMMHKKKARGYCAKDLKGDASLEQTEIFSRDILKNPGKLFCNLPRKENKIIIPNKYLKDSSLSFLVMSFKNQNFVVPLKEEDETIEKVNLKLEKNKEENYIYNYSLKINYMKEKEKIILKNIENTEFCIIENRNKLFETISLLNNSESLKKWSFLKNWENLSITEKLDKFNEFVSHEMNLFLYYKDKEFFEEVVAPYIANKKELELIDHFLLNNVEALRSYCKISKIPKLKKIELILLVLKMKYICVDFCNSVSNYFQSSADLINISEDITESIFKKILFSENKNTSDNFNKVFDQLDKLYNEKRQKSYDYQKNGEIGDDESEGMEEDDATQYYDDNSNCEEDECEEVNLFGEQQECEEEEQRFPQRRNQNQRGEKEKKNKLDVHYDRKDFLLENCKELDNKVKGTIEYREKQNFFELADSLIVERFWNDLMVQAKSRDNLNNFFSENFIYSCKNLSDCIFILIFSDLMWNGEKPTTELVDKNLELIGANPIVIFSKEIIQKKGEKFEMDVLLAQKYFDPDDRYYFDENDVNVKYEKIVKEFLIGKVYGCKIVLTNSSSSDLELNLITEVPQGSLPIKRSDYLKVEKIRLKIFETKILEFFFYFPEIGVFTSFPATVFKDNKIIVTAAKIDKIVVNAKKTAQKLETINDILQMGKKEDIVDFISKKNILNSKILDFSQIYWLLNDSVFYQEVIKALKMKGIYNNIVWSFCFFHKDYETYQEFVQYDNNLKEIPFDFLKTEFFTIDNFKLKEYFPLINPRAHSVGEDKTNIFNSEFRTTYLNFLNYLFEKHDYSNEDLLIFTNYLIVQDRNEEAFNTFQKIDRTTFTFNTKIQYDYTETYLDFIMGYPDFTIAKRNCENYLDYPVLKWKNLFVEIANQLSEFEESDLMINLLNKKENEHTQTKKEETTHFSVEIEKDEIKLTFNKSCQFFINYYRIDLEVLFSVDPLKKTDNKYFSYVKPFKTVQIDFLTENQFKTQSEKIHQEIRDKNCLIEIVQKIQNTNYSKFLQFTPCHFNFFINEKKGILKIVDLQNKTPLSKVYIKVFGKLKNSENIMFYKDGYTDLRGSFDYLALNKEKINKIEKFAALIVSENFGNKIVSFSPPVQTEQNIIQAKGIISQNWRMKASNKNQKQQQRKFCYVEKEEE